MSKSVALSLIAILFLAGIGYFVFKSTNSEVGISTPTFNPASPSPNPNPAPSPTPTPGATGGCYVGGCSSQICSEDKDAVSTCEYREEYACYRMAKCERQPTGQCGWTETPEFAICWNAARESGQDPK